MTEQLKNNKTFQRDIYYFISNHLTAHKVLSQTSNHLTFTKLCKLGYLPYREDRTSTRKLSNATTATQSNRAEAGGPSVARGGCV